MIRAEAAKQVARSILEIAAPHILTDRLVELAASLIMNVVEADEVSAWTEALEKRVRETQS